MSEPRPMVTQDELILARAVRATVHDQVVDLLERRGLSVRSDLLQCPVCGDRIILLDEPGTYSFDHERKSRVCAACGAERDFINLSIGSAVDIGGEG